jgi:hypothetical protein
MKGDNLQVGYFQIDLITRINPDQVYTASLSLIPSLQSHSIFFN